MEGQHETPCDKICQYHNSHVEKLSGLETGSKVAVIIVTLVLGLMSTILVMSYNTLAKTDELLHHSQAEYKKEVSQKTDRALDEVRDMRYELSNRMLNIEREQEHIKGSNERIIGYLKVLIKERGIELLPDTGD